MTDLRIPMPQRPSKKKNSHSEPDKCVVYWDYENMAIPKKTDLCTVISALKTRMWKTLNFKIPIEFRVYISVHKLTSDLCRDFERSGITQIHVPSNKPEAADKRIICDIALSLYELECDHKSRAIGLISSDHDFGYLLNKLHLTRPITHSFLISLHPGHVIDDHLRNSVDTFIILDNLRNKSPRQEILDDIKQISPPKAAKICIKLTDANNSKHSFEIKTSLKNAIANIINVVYGKLMDPPQPKVQLYLKFNNQKICSSVTVGEAGFVDGSQVFWCWEKFNDEAVEDEVPASTNISVILQHISTNQQCKFMVSPATKIKKIKARMKRECEIMQHMKYVTLRLKDQQMTNLRGDELQSPQKRRLSEY